MPDMCFYPGPLDSILLDPPHLAVSHNARELPMLYGPTLLLVAS